MTVCLFCCLPQMSPEWDETVADHILQTHHRRGGSKQADGSGAASGGRQRHQPAEAAEVDSQASLTVTFQHSSYGLQSGCLCVHATGGRVFHSKGTGGKTLLSDSALFLLIPYCASAGLAAGPAASVRGVGQGSLHSGP